MSPVLALRDRVRAAGTSLVLGTHLWGMLGRPHLRVVEGSHFVGVERDSFMLLVAVIEVAKQSPSCRHGLGP